MFLPCRRDTSWALLLLEADVLYEGHRPEVEEDGHDPQLDDAPNAQQEATQAQLWPADPKHLAQSFETQQQSSIYQSHDKSQQLRV